MLDEADNSVEVENGPSIEDTIRSVVEREPVQEEIEQPKPERTRDEKGKFAKVEQEEVTEPSQELPKRKPPGSLRKEAQEKWDTLDPLFQEEFERREADFHKGIQPYKEKAQFADNFESVINSYPAMQQFRQSGGNPLDAVNNLLQADHVLRYGTPEQKQGFVKQLLTDYGIDLGEQNQVNVNPSFNELQALKSTVNNLIHSQEQAQLLAKQREIDSWAQGKEFFKELEPTMAALLQSGQASSLDQAYEAASWMNPAIRQKILAKQQEEQRQEAAKKAAEAKKAAYVNFPAKGKVRGNFEPKGTMEDTIRASVMKAFN